MNRALIVSAAVLAAAALLAVGYLGGRHAGPSVPSAQAPAAAASTPRKVLYWYDPMVPQQHFGVGKIDRWIGLWSQERSHFRARFWPLIDALVEPR